MKVVLTAIDTVTDFLARVITRWMVVALVLVVVYDVGMRYIFNAPTMWAPETAIMIGGTIYVIGWSYCQLHRAHIRVDIFYGRLSLRGQAIIDILGHTLLFFPLMYLLIGTSWEWTWHAWAINEKSVATYWYPPIAPFRTVVTLGLFLYALQSVAQMARDLHLLIRNRVYD